MLHGQQGQETGLGRAPQEQAQRTAGTGLQARFPCAPSAPGTASIVQLHQTMVLSQRTRRVLQAVAWPGSAGRQKAHCRD
jgi:hypothetical protein